MKKILLFVLPVLFLVVGCEEDLGNCVLKGTVYYNNLVNIVPFVRYECYESVYTKKECMDKETQAGSLNLSYNSYITESCSEFCSDSPGEVCKEY